MAVYAVIQDSIVINMIMAEPDYTVGEGLSLVAVPSDLPATIGHTYNEPYFFDAEGNQVQPYPEEPIEEIEVTEVTE